MSSAVALYVLVACSDEVKWELYWTWIGLTSYISLYNESHSVDTSIKQMRTLK